MISTKVLFVILALLNGGDTQSTSTSGCTMVADTAEPNWYGAVAIRNPNYIAGVSPNIYEHGPLTENGCQDLCLNTPTCKRILWGAYSRPQACWMFSSVGALAPGHTVAIAYDKKNCVPEKLEYDCQANLEFWGGSTNGGLIADSRYVGWTDCRNFGFSTVESCQERCSELKSCAYMSWHAVLPPSHRQHISMCAIQSGFCYLGDASHSKTRDATHTSPSSTYCAKKQCTDSSQCSTGVCVGGVCKVPPTTSAPSTSPSKSPTKSPSKSPTLSPSSAPTAETFLLKIDGFHGSPIDALSNDAKSQKRAVIDRVNYVLRRLKEAEQ